MAKKKGIDVNSVILVIVIVLVVGLSLGIFYKAPVESGEGELGEAGMWFDDGMQDGDEMPPGAPERDVICVCKCQNEIIFPKLRLWLFPERVFGGFPGATDSYASIPPSGHLCKEVSDGMCNTYEYEKNAENMAECLEYSDEGKRCDGFLVGDWLTGNRYEWSSRTRGSLFSCEMKYK